MPIFYLGYLVGTLVTKTVRAFVDPHTPPPSRFRYPKPVQHKYELEEPLPIQQTEASYRHCHWPSTTQTRPSPATVPPASVETQTQQRLGANVQIFRLSLRPQRRRPQREQSSLRRLGTWITRNMMENTYILGGASALGLVALPFIRARMLGGSFLMEAGVATVSHMTQAGIVAAAPTAGARISTAYSTAQRGIVTAAPRVRTAARSMARAGTAAIISMRPHVANGIKQTFHLSWILLIRIFLMCVIFFVFTHRAIFRALTVLTARGDATLITEDIIRRHNLRSTQQDPEHRKSLLLYPLRSGPTVHPGPQANT